MRQLKNLFQMRISIGKSIFSILGLLLLISIMSITGCGGDSGSSSINNVSEDSSSSIGTEEESSSSSGIITKESSSSVTSGEENSSSSSGVKPIQEAISSSSSAIVSDGTCDSLITPFTRTYSSYLEAGINVTTGVLEVSISEVDSSIPRYESEITIEVRKDSTFFTFDKEEGYSYKYQNVSCEETIDGELRIYSEEVFDKELNKDVPRYTLISDINGEWDMFSLREQQYWVMGDSPYIDSIYWEQD